MARSRALALLLLMAVVAVACGGRVDQDTVLAEAAADGRAGGDGFGGGFVGDDSFGGSVDGVTAGGSGGSGSARATTGGGAGSGSASGGGGSGATTGGGTTGGGRTPLPPAPEGGNGGATDVGVTDTTVAIGNVATISGPVTGLFRGALIGTQAYFAMINSQGGLYGRQFTVQSGDDSLDNGKNKAKHKELKDKVFAFVGSFSTSDAGGVSELEGSGVPDIGRELSRRRGALPNHFSPVPVELGWVTTAQELLKQRFGADVVAKTAFLWAAVEASRENAQWFMNAGQQTGWDFVYTREVPPNEVSFSNDIVQMQRLGVRTVMFLGDIGNLANFWRDMHQQRSSWKPDLKYVIATAYDSSWFARMPEPAAADGTIISQNVSLYLGEDAQRVPEVGLFLEWMKRIDPGQPVDLFAFYGWTSAKLFVEAATAVGPNLTREALMAHLRSVHEYDGDGLQLPVDIGRKRTLGACEVFIEAKDSTFRRWHPQQGFDCSGRFIPFT